ncbi:sigma-70 family RNA polymerase sigma factor, partial [Candidatus Woesearchaeota archaeon]|nr:sigma-70 family RNA polymerase sigma factor [Candidatus Woesearchaeota archaeon]
MQFFDPEMLFPHPVADENPQSDVERTELKRILEECMEDLDEKYKEVLVLRYFEDMDYK